VRTLVVSDLHLGARARPGVLVRPEPLRRLLDALDGADRLVLLGDVFETTSRRGMLAGESVVRAIGDAVGSDREIVFVPGNHDRRLVRGWIASRGADLTIDDVVPRDASPALAQLTAWLEPAQVSIRYPGVWLSGRVWATHGHYLDQHLLPESPFGLRRRALARPAQDEDSPHAYETRRIPSRPSTTALLEEVLPGPLAALADTAADLARASTMPVAPRRVLHPRMSRIISRLLGTQMRRASIPALARVVARLGIDADWVLFGHVHRLGPVTGDQPEQWQAPGGRPRIVNTGSWVYEPLLVHRAQPPHPYWPGGAVAVEDERDPVVFGLLDDVSAEALR
jgi:predicted phosphodiesterase